MTPIPMRHHRPAYHAWLLAALLTAGLCSNAMALGDTSTEFPVIALSAGIHAISAEVATSMPEKARGLMFRAALGPNQGMLFLSDTPNQECMWMKNTLIPLSVAFINADGTIANIEDMQAQTETNHCAAHPVSYSLEMNLGWFKKHGVSVGSKISGLPH